MAAENAVDVALADFADRRGEIDKRSAEQHALIRLNITAAGLLAGLVVAERGDRLLLLVLPPIASALAMFWANHVRVISRIGNYIYYYIKPVVDPGRMGPLLHWEVVHDVYVSKKERAFRWGVPVLMVFILPPAAAMVFAFSTVLAEGDPVLWAVLGADAVLTLYAGALLATCGIFDAPRERKPSDPADFGRKEAAPAASP